MSSPSASALSRLGPRGTFGLAILNAADSDERIVGLTADLSITAGMERFRIRFPERFFNVGIAEQNLLGISSGLAEDGWKPYAVTFANFASMRSCEFVRHHLGYMKQNVKLVGVGAGFAMGQFGTSHYSIEDIGALRSIPNLNIVCPADCGEVFDAVQSIAKTDSPTYLRLTGAPSMKAIDQSNTRFEVGKVRRLRGGKDLTILASGSMVAVAVAVADSLEMRGIAVGVANVHTIKPFDTDGFREIAQETSAFISIEEHSILGGLGSTVAETITTMNTRHPLLRLGVKDFFPKVGSYEFVLDECGLTPKRVQDDILHWLEDTTAHAPNMQD